MSNNSGPLSPGGGGGGHPAASTSLGSSRAALPAQKIVLVLEGDSQGAVMEEELKMKVELCAKRFGLPFSVTR